MLGSLYFAFFGSKMLRDTGYIPEFAQTERKQLDKRKAVISCTTLFVVLLVIAISPDAVSYTHLDVYKRQGKRSAAVTVLAV